MEEKFITLGIIPTTYCNLRCKFCFHPREELSNNYLLPISEIKKAVYSLQNYYKTSPIAFTIYGGEVFAVYDEYLQELLEFLTSMSNVKTISFITNTTLPLPKILREKKYIEDDRILICSSLYPSNKHFKKYCLQYQYYYKNKLSVTILNWRENKTVESYKEFLRENHIPFETTYLVYDLPYNDVSSLYTTGKYLYNDDDLERITSTCDTNGHFPSYTLLSTGKVSLGTPYTVRFESMYEAIYYREKYMKDPKCHDCIFRGTCPTLPKICVSEKKYVTK